MGFLKDWIFFWKAKSNSGLRITDTAEEAISDHIQKRPEPDRVCFLLRANRPKQPVSYWTENTISLGKREALTMSFPVGFSERDSHTVSLQGLPISIQKQDRNGFRWMELDYNPKDKNFYVFPLFSIQAFPTPNPWIFRFEREDNQSLPFFDSESFLTIDFLDATTPKPRWSHFIHSENKNILSAFVTKTYLQLEWNQEPKDNDLNRISLVLMDFVILDWFSTN